MAKKSFAPRHVLFGRIGWMRFYKGRIPGDERPRGGGAYNKTRVGSEVSNFAAVDGKLYGYVQVYGGSAFNIGRISSQADDADRLTNVLLIFVAKHPTDGGQRIIGWHRNATVFREYQLMKARPGSKDYTAVCAVPNGVLLPTWKREHRVPSGRGGLGQSNVCYPLASGGTPKWRHWMSEAVAFVEGYDGPNLLEDPEAEADRDVSNAVERALSQARGQGFGGTAVERRALDSHAMKRAGKYFRKKGYVVEDVSKSKPYDLLCKKGSHELHVEVKGTTTVGDSVVLTRGEVEWKVKNGTRVLYILHSIMLDGKNASGGQERIDTPWKIDRKDLTPISYIYQVPEHLHT